MTIDIAWGPWTKKALRPDQMEVLLCAGHGDIEQGTPA
jgi:hypothetical protein